MDEGVPAVTELGVRRGRRGLTAVLWQCAWFLFVLCWFWKWAPDSGETLCLTKLMKIDPLEPVEHLQYLPG